MLRFLTYPSQLFLFSFLICDIDHFLLQKMPPFNTWFSKSLFSPLPGHSSFQSHFLYCHPLLSLGCPCEDRLLTVFLPLNSNLSWYISFPPPLLSPFFFSRLQVSLSPEPCGWLSDNSFSCGGSLMLTFVSFCFPSMSFSFLCRTNSSPYCLPTCPLCPTSFVFYCVPFLCAVFTP